MIRKITKNMQNNQVMSFHFWEVDAACVYKPELIVLLSPSCYYSHCDSDKSS